VFVLMTFSYARGGTYSLKDLCFKLWSCIICCRKFDYNS